jgi:hypothetical protein
MSGTPRLLRRRTVLQALLLTGGALPLQACAGYWVGRVRRAGGGIGMAPPGERVADGIAALHDPARVLLALPDALAGGLLVDPMCPPFG